MDVRPEGFSLTELLFAVALGTTLVALALPPAMSGLDEMRTEAAARYLAARLRLARFEAVKRSVRVGFRFERYGADYQYAMYLDGNRNGIRSSDIRRGVDRVITPREELANQFSGVRFGMVDGVPLLDGGGSGGDDGVRVGSANIVTFSADGTATPGTLYIRGRTHAQYAVRIFGATGRTRVLKFHSGDRIWIEQ